MKHLPLLVLALLASPARPQTDDLAPRIVADAITRDGALTRGAGHVQAALGALLLTGDSGSLNTETGDIEVNGRAKVVLPARADRNLIRIPSGGAIASGDPVVITADRLMVKSGLLLRGRGHVEAVIREERLQADEVDVYLKIGDGEVRGHVLLNGAEPRAADRRQVRRPFFFPPEIWK
jgi:hypothetical protein